MEDEMTDSKHYELVLGEINKQNNLTGNLCILISFQKIA